MRMFVQILKQLLLVVWHRVMAITWRVRCRAMFCVNVGGPVLLREGARAPHAAPNNNRVLIPFIVRLIRQNVSSSERKELYCAVSGVRVFCPR
jgi:hypothetical protein